MPVLRRTLDGLLASGVVERAVVLVAAALHKRARRVLGGLPVAVSVDPPDAAAVLRRAGGSAVLVHDAARPLTPPALTAAVSRSVPAHGAVVPVLPLADTVKRVNGDGLVHDGPDRAVLRVVQTPQAFAAELLVGDVLADVLAGVLAAPPEQAWRFAGGGDGPCSAVTVPGDALAFPVRSAWDRERAEALLDGAVPAVTVG